MSLIGKNESSVSSPKEKNSATRICYRQSNQSSYVLFTVTLYFGVTQNIHL